MRGPVADGGIAADQLPDAIGRGGDLLLTRIARVGHVVVVADDHLDTPEDEALDRFDQIRRRSRVNEDYALRVVGDGSEDVVRVRHSEKL